MAKKVGAPIGGGSNSDLEFVATLSPEQILEAYAKISKEGQVTAAKIREYFKGIDNAVEQTGAEVKKTAQILSTTINGAFQGIKKTVTTTSTAMVDGVKTVTKNVEMMGDRIKGASITLESFTRYAEHWAIRMAMFWAAFKVLDIIKDLTVGFSDYVRELEKTAEVTGLTTEQFQKLNYAAKINLVDTKTLERAFDYTNKAVERFGQANERATRAFHALGLKYNEINDLKPYELFLKIADGFAKIPSASERAFVATEVFGRGQREMIALATQGGDAIKKLGEDYAKSGALISDETTRLVTENAKAFAQFKADWGESLRNWIGTSFTYWATAYSKMLGYMSAETRQFLTNTLIEKNSIEEINKLKKESQAISARIAKAEEGMTAKQIEDLNKTNSVYQQWKKDLDAIQTKIQIHTELWEINSGAVGQARKDFEGFIETGKKGLPAVTKEIKKLQEAYEDFVKSMRYSGAKIDVKMGKEDYLRGLVDKPKPNQLQGLETLDEQIKRVTEDLIDAEIASEEFYASIYQPTEKEVTKQPSEFKKGFLDVFRQVYDRWHTTVDNMGKVTKGLSKIGAQFGNAMVAGIDSVSSGFARLITQGGKFKDVLLDALQQIIDQLIKMAMEMLVINGIMSLFGGFGGGFGGGANPTALGKGFGFLPFAKGGYPGTTKDLPKIPHAEKGLFTGSGASRPVPIIAHTNEIIMQVKYVRELFGAMAERFLTSGGSLGGMRPITQTIGGGDTNLIINISGGTFDDPSYWRNVVRTKIKPALDEVRRVRGER